MLLKSIEKNFIFEPAILLPSMDSFFKETNAQGSREVNLFDDDTENESQEDITRVIRKTSKTKVIVFRRDGLILE